LLPICPHDGFDAAAQGVPDRFGEVGIARWLLAPAAGSKSRGCRARLARREVLRVQSPPYLRIDRHDYSINPGSPTESSRSGCRSSADRVDVKRPDAGGGCHLDHISDPAPNERSRHGRGGRQGII
jgi:hypothetical protein